MLPLLKKVSKSKNTNMTNIGLKKGYTFDDVLLVPKYSEIESRRALEISQILTGQTGLAIYMSHPVVAANMSCVSEWEMALEMARMGSFAPVHRNMSVEQQGEHCKKAKECWLEDSKLLTDPAVSGALKESFDALGLTSHWERLQRRLEKYRGLFPLKPNFAFAIGVRGDYKDRLSQCAPHCNIVLIDIAHAHYKWTAEVIKYIRKDYPQLFIIAKTVATPEGAKFLHDAGADVIGVNIGGGSLCTTRIVTGAGVPIVTSLLEIREELGDTANIMLDGGLREPGDLVKAHAAGADIIMSGAFFYGVEETPGKVRPSGPMERSLTKTVYGMASVNAQEHLRVLEQSQTDFFADEEDDYYVEGEAVTVPFRGKAVYILRRLFKGLRSGMSYLGCNRIVEIRKNATFVEVSSAGQQENQPHAQTKYR